MRRIQLRERAQSQGEEIANSVSHGLGLCGVIAMTPILIVMAARGGSATAVVGASIFGTTLILLYLSSTLYHALPRNRAKHVFKILDHSAIYLLIAGTYTPFMLVALGGAWGWSLFGVVWGLAILGVVLESVGGVRYPTLSTLLYLAMGWLIVIGIEPLWTRLPHWGLFWIAMGGLAYTVGVPFFVARQRFAHLVWHVLVLTGTTCHIIAVYHYAIG